MNPLLSRDFLMPFDRIRPEDVVPGIEEAVERGQADVERIAGLSGARTYEDTVAALDDAIERVDRAVGMAGHLMAVANEAPLREAFNEALPIFSAFYAKLPTHAGLWQAFQQYATGAEAQSLDPVRRRRLDKLLEEFRRAGADLPEETRRRVEDVRTELARLGTDFGNNLLDSTNRFELVLTEEEEVAGLPESALQQARRSAKTKGVDGWRFTLQGPSYLSFMQYAERRDLRERMYRAFRTRATDEENDNRPLVKRILALRRDLALLLGYRDFADYRLEINMVGTGDAATAFERELFEKTLPYWQEEIADLERFAAEDLGLSRLEPWDTAWVTERMRRSRFDLDSEQLRPYFPLPGVLSGVFEVARRLFGVQVSESHNDAVWHPDVRYFEVRDEAGRHVGSFYADFFPRESKRAGAWMNGLISGQAGDDGSLGPHLGLIVTNFTQPHEDRPALLTHREVQTLFHEFGHLLHHLLSRVELPALSGTNVPRDWVEVPSHFMENWTWEREALDLFARHVDTGETIPDDLFAKLQASRSFMEANSQMRQLSFGTVDLALHVDYDPSSGNDPVEYGNRVREKFVIRPEFAHDAFLCAFAHIFAGGYAAGYYSYKWSEMLEADAFTRFEERGIFDRETGREFVDAILSQGDSRDQAQQFRTFMGREPDSEALLRRNLGDRYGKVAQGVN